MDEFTAARLRAAREVMAFHEHDPHDPKSPEPSHDYVLRRIFRHFSRMSGIPLDRVEEKPLAYVLTHYYELVYEEKAESEGEGAAEAWREEMQRLAESDEERAKRVAEELAERRKSDELLRETVELDRINAERQKAAEAAQGPRKGQSGGSGLGSMRGEAFREAAAMGAEFDREAKKLLGAAERLKGISRRYGP